MNIQNNIGYACTRKHVELGLGQKIAFRFIKINGSTTEVSFDALEKETNKFANLSTGLGMRKGDVFFTFLPKCHEQIVTFVGSLKKQLITGTLYANLGEEAVMDRLRDAKAKGIITRKNIFIKLERIWDKLPDLEHILLVDIDDHFDKKVKSYSRLLSEYNCDFEIDDTDIATPSVLHYTSGSTGRPKGVLHVHNSLVMLTFTTKETLQLNDNDVFWCTADPGWVTGTSYGIIGPCSLGISQVCYEGGMNVVKWLEILVKERITVWYTAPTALRMIMQETTVDFPKYDLSVLRNIFSVGEPLNPEILRWSRKVLNKEIYDTYFQTETGAIMISNRPDFAIKPGSMGIPGKKIECEILDDDGQVLSANKPGNLCIKTPWESMFVAYLNSPEVYANKFKSGYYYTGDQAFKTEDGYFSFIGRLDDIINTAGHLVSPFEVESALLEMEQIADVAVIGVTDAIFFEKVVAFVKLASGFDNSPDLNLQIRLFVSKRVSPIAAPTQIRIVERIPKNKSGKIMRRYLRALYEGKDPGDISTMDQ
jgi:acetyl-CoA synthetase